MHGTEELEISRCGRLVGLIEDAGRVRLLVRLSGGTTVEVKVSVRGDRAAALRHLAGLRRVRLLRIDLTARPPRCQLWATTRLPLTRVLPLRAALAVASSGVPTIVRITMS